MSNKTSYPTFARTLAPSSKISKSLIATLEKFDWYKVVVIAGNTTAEYRQIEDAFRQGISRVNELYRAANEAASTMNTHSDDTTSLASFVSHNQSSLPTLSQSRHDGEWQFPFNISLKFVNKKMKPKYREFKIIESHHIPSTYLDSKEQLVKEIAQNGKSKTRSKYSSSINHLTVSKALCQLVLIHYHSHEKGRHRGGSGKGVVICVYCPCSYLLHASATVFLLSKRTVRLKSER